MQMVLVRCGRLKRYFDLLKKNIFFAGFSLLRRKRNTIKIYVPELIATRSLLKMILILIQEFFTVF